MRLLLEVEPVRVNPRTDTPKTIEQMEREMDLADALQYQRSASANHISFRRSRKLTGTVRLATEQYAYARWLMGIDDYYLSIPVTERRGTTPRPHRRVSAGHGDHTPRAALDPAAMDLARQRLLTPWTPGAWRRSDPT